MTEQTALKSFLVPMLDFPREHEDETNLWFDSDHVPERLSCDGIESCDRFQLTAVEPIGWDPGQRWTTYLHFYRLRSLEVLTSPAYLRQREMNDGKGSVWRQLREERYAKDGRESPSRSLRTSWVQRPDAWSTGRPLEVGGPRAIYVVLRDAVAGLNERVDAFLDEQVIPELLRVPGFLGCERYDAAGPLAAVGARRGRAEQPRYMDVYDIATPEVVAGGPYRRFLAGLDADPSLAPGLAPVGSGVYVQRPSPWRAIVR